MICWELWPNRFKSLIQENPHFIPNHRQINLLCDSGWIFNLIYLYRRGLINWNQFVWSLTLSEDPKVINQLKDIDWSLLDNLNRDSTQLESLHSLISAVLSTTTDDSLAQFLINHPKLPLLVNDVGLLAPILKWEGSTELPLFHLFKNLDWEFLESPLVQHLVKIPANQLNSQSRNQLAELANQDSLRFNQLFSQALDSVALVRRKILDPSPLVKEYFNRLFYSFHSLPDFDSQPKNYPLTPLLQHLDYLSKFNKNQVGPLTLEIFDSQTNDENQMMSTLLLNLIEKGVNSQTFAMAYFLNLIKSLGSEDLNRKWFEILTRLIPPTPFNHRWLQFYFQLDIIAMMPKDELFRESLIETFMVNEDSHVFHFYQDIPLQYCLKILASARSAKFAQTVLRKTHFDSQIKTDNLQYPVQADFYIDPCQLQSYPPRLENRIFQLLKSFQNEALLRRFKKRIIDSNNFKACQIDIDLSWLPLIIEADNPNFLSILNNRWSNQYFILIEVEADSNLPTERPEDQWFPQISFYKTNVEQEKLREMSQELNKFIYRFDPYVADQIPMISTSLTHSELMLFYRALRLALPVRPEYQNYDRDLLALTLIKHLMSRFQENPLERWPMIMTIKQLMDFISFSRHFDWSEVPEEIQGSEKLLYDKWLEYYQANHEHEDIYLEFRAERLDSLNEDIEDFEDIEDEAEVLINAARNGDVELLEFLRNYGWGPEEARARSNRALIEAAKLGHVEVLRILHDLYGLTTEDARANYNLALIKAAQQGHAEVLRILHDLYGLTTEDARALDNLSLIEAAKLGHVEVLRILHDLYGLTTEDARAKNNLALIKAAQQGHADVLRILHDLYGLTTEDARANYNLALIKAAQQGHADVLRILHDLYGLTTEDARALNYKAIEMAILENHADVLKIFHNLYGLGPEDLQVRDEFGRPYLIDWAQNINNPQVMDVIRNIYGVSPHLTSHSRS